ncbi:MAG: DUF4199 domain-containing protein [Cyclobacteriaceae bacterium]|nr:DUF4199 domain-containing protein [Cyclobacteriaceae bacterium]
MFERAPRWVFIAMRNGLLAGVLGIVFLLVLYYVGRHPFLFPIYFDFRIIMLSVFVVMSLKELRDDHQQGLLSFGAAMICAFLFTLVFAVLVMGFVWIFSALNPAFVTDYIQLMTTQLRALDASIIEQIGKDAYERNLSALPATNGGTLAFDYFIKSLMISFFVSIIISVILRRQPKI